MQDTALFDYHTARENDQRRMAAETNHKGSKADHLLIAEQHRLQARGGDASLDGSPSKMPSQSSKNFGLTDAREIIARVVGAAPAGSERDALLVLANETLEAASAWLEAPWGPQAYRRCGGKRSPYSLHLT